MRAFNHTVAFVALALVLLRTIVPCHDSIGSSHDGASWVETLIAAAWCGAGAAPARVPTPQLPQNPVPEVAGLCLHCASGCTTGGSALAFWLLGFLIPRRLGKKISLAHRAKAPPIEPMCAGV